MSRLPGAVIDSSVLLDLFTEDERWLEWSREALATAASEGPLVINAVVVGEIAPRFARVEELRATIDSTFMIEEIPVDAAYLAGRAHASYRQSGGERSAILPDLLIGAHAAVTGRPLVTRDPQRIRTHLPGATIVAPD